MKAKKAAAAYSGYKASFRSAGDEEAPEEGIALISLDSYTPVGKINTRINTLFSKSTPREIIEAIGCFAEEHCTHFEVASKKPKALLRFLIDDDEIVEIKARLSKCKEEGLHAVEFSRSKGLNHQYIQKLEELNQAMGDIAYEQ